MFKFSAILSACLWLAISPWSLAQDPISVWISDGHGSPPGATVSVPIMVGQVRSSAHLNAFDIQLQYDQTLLNYTGISQAGTIIDTWDLVAANEPTPGDIRISAASTQQTELEVDRNAVLLFVEFQVEGSATVGACSTLTLADVTLNNGTPPSTTFNGELCVTAADPVISDLSLSQTISPATASPGDTVTITLTASNDGPDNAENVTVTNSFDAGIDDISDDGAGAYAGNTWTIGPLTSGDSASITFTATYNGPGIVAHVAQIATSDSGDPDSTPGNSNPDEDDYSRGTIRTPSADLSLSLRTNNSAPFIGGTYSYSIVLTNNGIDPTTNVTVTAALPAGIDFIGSSAERGTYADNVWTISSIAADESLTLEIEVMGTTEGIFAFFAEVSASDVFDPDSTPNNSDSQEDDRDGAVVLVRPALGATITIVNGDDPGEGLNDPTPIPDSIAGNRGTTLGQLRLNAVQYAADIWASFLISDQPITLLVRFDDLPCTGDGTDIVQGWPQTARRGVPGAPATTTWYPVALANTLIGNDDNLSEQEMNLVINSAADSGCNGVAPFYYGLDAAPGNNTDLVTVAIGGIARGLGFSSFINQTTGAEFFGTDDIASTFITDHDENQTWSEMDLAGRLTSASNGDGLTWNGPNVNEYVANNLNGGTHSSGQAMIRAQENSYRNFFDLVWHEDINPNGNPEPDYNGANHNPGIALAALYDLGWPKRDQADLALTMTVDNLASVPDETATYTITLTNQGPGPATGVTVSALLPGGLSYVNHSGDGTYTSTNGNWDIGDLNVNQNVTLTLSAFVEDLGSKTFFVEVSGSDQGDPDSGADNGILGEDDAAEITVGAADLDLDIVADKTTAGLGENVTFTITLTNFGPDDVEEVIVSDILATTAPSPLSWVSDDSGGTYDPATSIWDVGFLADGATTVLTLTTEVNTGGSFTFAAEVTNASRQDPDSTPANGSEDDYDSVTISTPIADLALDASLDNDAPALGDTVQYTLELVNDGPNDATNVQVQVDLSSGLSIQAHSGNGIFDQGAQTWTIPTIVSGQTLSRTIELRIDSEASLYTVTSQVSVSNVPDSDSTPNNYQGGEDDHVTVEFDLAESDLSLSLSLSNGTANVGDQITFTYSLTNGGPDTNQNVSVIAPLGSGLSYVSDSGNGSYNSSTNVWFLGQVNANSTQTHQVVVRVESAGSQVHIAQVNSADAPDPDSTPANNDPDEDDYAEVALGSADLSLEVAVDETSPTVGDFVTYTVSLRNLGPDDATGVSVLAPIPTGLTLSNTPANYNSGSGLWSPGTVSTGTMDLELVLEVESTGTKSFSAEVFSSQQEDADSTPGNSSTNEDDDDRLSITPVANTTTQIIIVNADPPGMGLNDTTAVLPVPGNPGTTLGQQRLNAVQYAADVWAALLHSDVPIYVQVNFEALFCTSGSALLGTGAPLTVARDFPGAPKSNTWYPTALANALVGYDTNGGTPEMRLRLNSQIDVTTNCLAKTWYYGTDANPGSDEIDLISTAIHEIGHGLGMLSLTDPGGNFIFNVLDTYSTNLIDNSTGKTWDTMTPSERSTSMRDYGDLLWAGPAVTTNSSGLSSGRHNSGRVEMYAPTSYNSGSSLHHFSDRLAPDELMEPFSNGPNHDPGLAFHVMRDIGWPTSAGADLELSVSLSNSTPELGDTITATLTLHNSGPGNTSNVEVEIDNFFGGNLAITNGSTTTGSSYDAGTRIWTTDSITSGQTQVLTLTFSVDGIDPADITAQVTASETFDPDSSPNNGIIGEDDDILITVTPINLGSADLSIATSVDQPNPTAGDTLTYTITLTNDGPDAATNIGVYAPIPPASFTYNGFTGNGTYSNAVWSVTSLPAGNSTSIDISLTVTSYAASSLTAQVLRVTEGDPDSDPGNNDGAEDDQSTTAVTPVPPGTSDMVIYLEVDEMTPDKGEEIQFQISAENFGPDTANGATVSLDLPSSLTYLSSSGDGSFDGSLWTLPDVANGATVQRLVQARVASAGLKTVTAELQSLLQQDPTSTPGNGDPTEDDQDTVGVLPNLSDISLHIALDNPVVDVDDVVIASFTITNDGPAAATGVSFEVSIPDGLAIGSQVPDGMSLGAGNTWNLDPINSGSSASLLIYLTVQEAGTKVISGNVLTSNSYDPDSTPGNTYNEDDMAEVSINTRSSSGATIVIANADGPGEGFNDTTPVAPIGGNEATTLGQQRLNAFQRAADIWGQFLQSDVTIVVNAVFDPLTCSSGSGILGSAGTTNVARDFAGAPQPNTWYHIALANAISGTDINGAQPEINARFNSSIDNNSNCLNGTNWYYGLDGNAGGDIDLVSVLLHEFAHGLGFSTFVNSSTGARFYGLDDVYMINLENHLSGKSWSEMDDGERAASAVGGSSLQWTGSNVMEGSSILTQGRDNNGHVEMFAPNPVRPGSSVSHFSTSLVPNELMEPYYTGPDHDPGLSVSLMVDLGWNTSFERSDLEVGLAVDNPTAGTGGDVTFTLSLTNSGPTDATGVTVAALLPAGFTYSGHSGDGSYDSGSGTWDLGGVSDQQTLSLQINATVTPDNARTFAIDLLTSDQFDPDSVPGNNVSSEDDHAAVTVGSADLELSLSVDDNTPDEGGIANITATLTNRGPDDAYGIQVSIPLPSSLQLYAINGDFDIQGQTWNVSSLASGASTDITLEVYVNTDESTTVHGEVSRSDRFDPDSTPDNGLTGEDDYDALVLVPVPEPKADLQFVLAIENQRPEVGQTSTLDIVLQNQGPNHTTGVTVEVFIPLGLSFAGLDGSGDFDPVTRIWNVGTMNSNSEENLRINVIADTPGSRVVEVLVQTSSTTDPDSIPGGGPDTEDDYGQMILNVQGNGGGSIIIQIGDSAGTGFYDPTPTSPIGGNNGTTLGQQRLNAFQHAADIWANLLDLNTDVVVYARFQPLNCSSGSGVLGSAGPTDVHRDFPGAPYADTWYPAALANHIAAYDINGSQPEINANFNSSIDNNNACLSNTNWYYGLDGNPSGNDIDLVSVLLHEMAHGLGFLTLVNSYGGRFRNLDDVFMKMLRDNSLDQTWDTMSDGQRSSSARDTNDLVWAGSNVNNAAGHLTSGLTAGQVQMYAPSGYQQGSSVSHFSTALFPNELMEPSYAEVTHDPGLALELMRDIGWGDAPEADISLTLGVSDGAPDFGDTITFTVTVTNDGPDDLNNVGVHLPLPAGLTHISDSGGGDYAGGLWDTGTISSGSDLVLTVQARVDSGNTQTITAEVSEAAANDPDSSPGNGLSGEDDQASITVVPTGSGVADLSLSLSLSEDSPALGEVVTLTVLLVNGGPNTGTGLSVSLPIPDGITVHSSSGGYNNGVWSVPDTNSGSSATLTLQVSSNSESPVTFEGQVRSSDQDDPDSAPNNGVAVEDDHDTALLTAVYVPTADLSLQMRVDDASPVAGGIFNLTLIAANQGPEAADEIRARVTLPAELSIIAADGDGVWDNGIWDIGTLASGGSASLVIQFLVESSGAKTVSAEVIFSSLTDPDSTPDNDVAAEDDQAAITVTPRSGAGAVIRILNADSPGEGFNDTRSVTPSGGNPGTTLGEQRLIAFQYAADIWASLLSSDVEIVVQAQFNAQSCSSGGGILGSAGPTTVHRNFPGALRANTWYPAALANALSGNDINGSSAELNATFNSSIDNNDNCLRGTNWYYGLDGNPGNNLDLVSVLLHEMAHGLGFLTLVDQGGNLFRNYDDIFMTFLEDFRTNRTWDELSTSERAASAVSGSNLQWNGPEVGAMAATLSAGRNGNQVEMYAPNPYRQGSSVSHFSTSLSPNALMEPSYTETIHTPEISAALLWDIGWEQPNKADLSLSANVNNTAPVAGDTVTMTLNLANAGPSLASGTTVQVDLSPGLVYVSDNGGGDYNSGTGLWNSGVVPVNGSTTLEIQFQVQAFGDRIAEAQVATSNEGDPDSSPGNDALDEDDHQRISLNSADLSLNIGAPLTDIIQGDLVTFTMTLSNDGPNTANDIQVQIPLPSGASFVTASGSGSFDSGSTIWSIDQLGVGSIAVLDYVVRANNQGTLTATAEVVDVLEGDPDSTPGSGSNEDDDDSTSITIQAPPAPELSLNIIGFYSVDCPNMTVRLQVLSDGDPVNSLGDGDFRISEDGTPLSFSLAAVSDQGEYELAYATPRPDGNDHTIDFGVTVGEYDTYASDTATNCHISGIITLDNDDTQNGLAGQIGGWRYFQIDVPANQGVLNIQTWGGNGDVDLFVKYGDLPTTDDYDHRPLRPGNDEEVSISSPLGGSYFIGLLAIDDYRGVKLNASYSPFELSLSLGTIDITACPTISVEVSATQDGVGILGLGAGDLVLTEDGNNLFVSVTSLGNGDYRLSYTTPNPDGEIHTIQADLTYLGQELQDTAQYQYCNLSGATPLENYELVQGLSGNTDSWQYFVLEVPDGPSFVKFILSGGTGDADMYVRSGGLPNQETYDFAPKRDGNEEIILSNTGEESWYIGIYGYQAFQDVTLLPIYGLSSPDFSIDSIDVVDCPTVSVQITAENRGTPIEDLVAGNIQISENNGVFFNIQELTHLGSGVYNLTYQTSNLAQEETHLVIQADLKGTVVYNHNSYSGCKRDGATVDAWINQHLAAQPDGTARVPVLVSAIEAAFSISQLQFEVDYDPNLLTYVGFDTADTLLTDWGLVDDSASTTGRVSFGAADATQQFPLSSPGESVLVTLLFQVADTASANDCTTLTPRQDSFRFNDGLPNVLTSAGQFCVPAHSCPSAVGDVDGNGNDRSGFDAFLILQIAEGTETGYEPIDLCVADTNCSGTVTITDALRVLQRGVGIIDDYCADSFGSGRGAGTFDIDIPFAQRDLGLDVEFTITIDVSQMVNEPAHGYRFQLNYDPSLITITGIDQSETITERWLQPTMDNENGQLTLTHLSPTASFEETGTLIKLVGSTSAANQGTTNLTFTQFALGSESEPVNDFTFPLTVSGSPCFVEEDYNNNRASWPQPSVLSLVQMINCQTP